MIVTRRMPAKLPHAARAIRPHVARPGAPSDNRRVGTVPPRKPAPAAAAAETVDVLAVLAARKLLTAEQADRVRRSVAISKQSPEQAIVQLGFASEIQIAQALAAHAGLAFVKINPLELDLDVVTRALPGYLTTNVPVMRAEWMSHLIG